MITAQPPGLKRPFLGAFAQIRFKTGRLSRLKVSNNLLQMMLRILLSLGLILCPIFAFADKFSVDSSYKICFTPEQNCTDLIVSIINLAQKNILVQAYSFTSVPIAKALVQAKRRGIDVKIILDRSQNRKHGFSSAKYFSDYQIPVLIDYQPNIAHNKVMVVDSKIVITGSFNFTRAAQERNAENVIVISDREFAKKYVQNWEQRAKVSDQPWQND
jgi:phosphatidylserine/phosphatidylglycerophosphate/cardiolipin synthase-like enzyme